MKVFISFSKIIVTLFILLLISNCKCEDNIISVICKVVSKPTQAPLKDVKIIYNGTQNFVSDIEGKFKIDFNLECYLADSIAFYVTKDNFHSQNYSTIIGNTQKDIILIQMDPK